MIGGNSIGVDEWIVRLVKRMYSNARSRVCVGEGYSEEFEVKVIVHQGSVLSPLMMMRMMMMILLASLYVDIFPKCGFFTGKNLLILSCKRSPQ